MAKRSCSMWLNRRTGLEKTLLSLSLILLFTCVIIIAVGMIHQNGSSNGNDDHRSCMTTLCLETAADVMSKADFSVNPCDDFYQFACGQYETTRFAPMDDSKASISSETSNSVLLEMKEWLESTSEDDLSVNKKVKILFRSCMNSDQKAENVSLVVRRAFEEYNLNTWPVLNPSWQEDNVKQEDIMAHLTLLGIPIVVQLEIIPDTVDKGKFIAKFSPGKPLFQDHQTKALGKDGLHLNLEAVLTELGVRKHTVAFVAEDIYSLERNYLMMKQLADTACKDNKSYAVDLSLERLKSYREMADEMHTILEWDQFLEVLFDSLKTVDIPDFPIEMFCRRHMRELNDAFHGYAPVSTYNYFGWRFVSTFVQYLGPKFHWLQEYSKYEIDGGQFRPKPIWKTCVSLASEYFFPVLVNAYRQKSVTEELLKEKRTIATALRLTLNELLSKIQWLSDDKKQKLKQKVMNARFELPMANLPPETRTLDDYFSKLNLMEDHVALNILRLKRYFVKKSLKRLLVSSEEYFEWNDMGLISDENFRENDGNIVIHFNNIRRPYLSEFQQSYLNYGGFGTFLARELNRLVETIRYSSGNGSQSSLWDLFVQRAQNECSLEKEDNSEESIEERNAALAELSAIQASYKAYQENKIEDEASIMGLNLTHNQMFFLSYAQGMCESKTRSRSTRTRVNFALRNSNGFSSSFSCPVDSPMNPSKKCHLWG